MGGGGRGVRVDVNEELKIFCENYKKNFWGEVGVVGSGGGGGGPGGSVLM